jgi:hypothetical protein
MEQIERGGSRDRDKRRKRCKTQVGPALQDEPDNKCGDV